MPPRSNVIVSRSEYAEMARLGVNVTKTPVRSTGMRGIVNGPGFVRPLVAGTMRFPAAAIKFPDLGNTNSIAQFDSMLFGTWASGSAHGYYEQVSYGQFTFTVKAVDKRRIKRVMVTLEKPESEPDYLE